MRPSLRPTLLALACAVCALVVLASPAFADITTSDITSPADGTVITFNSETPDTVTVSGTSNGGAADQLRIDCYYGDTSSPIVRGVAVMANGSFSASIATTDFLNLWQPCVLRAAQDIDATPVAPPGTTSTFSGPTIRVDGTQLTRIAGGPNDGNVEDFYLQNIQSQGGFDFHSTGYCGLYDSFLWDPTTFEPATPLFFCNDNLLLANGDLDTPDPGTIPATGSELTVDGANAFLPGAISDPWPDTTTDPQLNPGMPAVGFTAAFASSTHAASFSESSSAVRCAPAPAIFPPDGTSCSSFVNTGVRLDRTAAVTNDGLLATIRTRWSSTDGASHQLHLEIENDQHAAGNDIAYVFPWVSASYATESLGATVPGPPSGPGHVDVTASLAHGDDGTVPHGVIVFSRPPKDERFIDDETGLGGAVSSFLAEYDLTVPAAGSVSLAFAYGQAFSQSQANALGSQAETSFTPSISMNAPAHSTPANHVAVSGSASAPLGVTAVSVNGTPATLAADGSWKASVPLNGGHNALVATVTAADGASASTSPADVVYAKLGLVGKFRAKGHFVVFRMHCAADPSGSCPGSALLVSKEKLRGKRVLGVSAKRKTRSRHVTVGRKRFRVKGGKTVTIKVPLGKTGLKLLKRFHKLPVRVSVSVAATGVKTRVGGSKVVFHGAKPKHKKKHHA